VSETGYHYFQTSLATCNSQLAERKEDCRRFIACGAHTFFPFICSETVKPAAKQRAQLPQKPVNVLIDSNNKPISLYESQTHAIRFYPFLTASFSSI
jgi:hypothetical protein